MSNLVVDGATLTCSSGSSTCSLSITTDQQQGDGSDAAAVSDNTAYEQISGFSYCTIMQSSCTPAFSSDWSSGDSTVAVDGDDALTSDSTLSCSIGGTVSISDAGQSTVTCG